MDPQLSAIIVRSHEAGSTNGIITDIYVINPSDGSKLLRLDHTTGNQLIPGEYRSVETSFDNLSALIESAANYQIISIKCVINQPALDSGSEINDRILEA
jgi:hypothetical protein